MSSPKNGAEHFPEGDWWLHPKSSGIDPASVSNFVYIFYAKTGVEWARVQAKPSDTPYGCTFDEPGAGTDSVDHVAFYYIPK